MLDVIKLNFIKGSNLTDTLSDKFKTKGLLGSFLLGALFALAFCPYSGALFFAMLIPMTLSVDDGLFLTVLFSIGTSKRIGFAEVEVVHLQRRYRIWAPLLHHGFLSGWPCQFPISSVYVQGRRWGRCPPCA